jgi:hypothetical protein
MMNREEIWQKCPIGLKNEALSIARTYNHGWAWSTAVPAPPYFWEFDDPVPSLEEIEEGTPEGPVGKGISGPDVSYNDGKYTVRHKTGTGRVTVEVSLDPIKDLQYTFTVVVARPDGAKVSGTKNGDSIKTEADWSIWGVRHENAWRMAWHSLGVTPPDFPGKLLESDLLIQGNGLDSNPLYHRVTVLPGAVLSTEDLLNLRKAASVELLDGTGHSYTLTIG